MLHLAVLTINTIFDALHSVLPAFMWFLCGYLYALHYDRLQLKCAYFMWRDRLYILLLSSCLSTMAASFEVAFQRNSGTLFVLGFAQVVVCFSAYARLDAPRMKDRYRVISVRYMQHKYGLEGSLLLALVDRHKFASFPIVYFERQLKLTGAQRESYEATDEVRTAMKLLVERRFCDPLSATDIKQPDCVKACQRYRQEMDSDAMNTKLTRITRDFYSAPEAKPDAKAK